MQLLLWRAANADADAAATADVGGDGLPDTLNHVEKNTCGWVGEVKTNRCVRLGVDGRYAWEACRAACFSSATEVRGECSDSAEWHKKNDDTKTCSWVAGKPPTRCNVKGQDGTWAFDQCPEACNTC